MSEKKRADALLQECYNEYRIKLFNYCLSRLDGIREAADDCVQETFIVFYDKLLEGEQFGNPRAFLYRTADNFVKRQKQKAASELRREVPLESVSDIGVNDEYIAKLDEIDFEECAEKLINTLTDEEKTIYDLRYIRKLGVEDVAEKLGISRPAASMRLMRLRNKITTMVYSFDIEKKGG
ncbi:MAG: sigma-70 family RNA polymerase sigma factor [Acutalibacteraceae bacterium]|nr:sigma-70 family RNA polymerase sigma factor [Acutalibacteraceae bacterium]